MHRTLRLALLAGASAPALAGAAFAQSTADLIVLDAIEVDGAADPYAPVPGYVATTAQTATKTGTPILETPQSLSVVTGEQIEDQGATTLGDTLGYSAGVFAQPFGTDPRFDSPTIRGFNGSNAQYLNGLRILRDFGAPSFEIYGLERIEILKGPASVLYGSAIPGGVVNQVQKRAQAVNFGEVGVGLGDPKATEGFIDVNRVLTEDLSVRLTAVGRDSEEDVEALTQTRGYLGLAGLWTPAEGSELELLASFQKDDPITPSGVPFDLVGQVPDEQLRSFYAGDPADDASDRTTLNLGFEARQELGGGWRAEAGLRWQKFDWDYTGFYVNNAVADGDTVTRGANNTFEDSSTWNLDARVTGTVDMGPVAHTLLFGLDLRRYAVEDWTEFMSADAISFSNPVYGGANLSAPWYISENDLTLDQVGVYAQNEMAWGGWRLSLAARHDWAEQSGTAYTNFAGTSRADQSDTAFTGRAGLVYVFENGIAPYASVATSFDPEIGVDINGDPLSPTRGTQYEIGVKYEPTFFDGFFSVSAFDLTQSDVASTVIVGGVSGLNQIGEVKSQGVEVEASVSWDGWNLRGAYTYNDARQTRGDNAGADMPNAPMHNLGLWANYTFGEGPLSGLTLGGGMRYQGDRFGDAANAYALDDALLFDVQAAYEVTEAAAVSLNITNLADKAYVANCGAFGCYFADGRTVQARLTYKW